MEIKASLIEVGYKWGTKWSARPKKQKGLQAETYNPLMHLKFLVPAAGLEPAT